MDVNRQEQIEKLTDKSLSIESRVSMLAELLSDIDPNQSLAEVLELVIQECKVVKAAYQSLSQDIESELFGLLDQINEKKIESFQIDNELLSKEKEKNRYCSIYSKVPPLKNLQDDADYDYFFSKYQQGTLLSQQISELNLKVMHLLDIQKSLDHTFASSMIETDYLLRKVGETMRTFKYMKTPDLINSYKSKYCFYGNLQKMVEAKNGEFETFLKKNDGYQVKGSL